MRFVFLLLATACASQGPTSAEPTQPAEASVVPVAATAATAVAAAPEVPVEAVAAAAAVAGGLPDVGANLPHGQCANGPGNEGADSYFTGQFTVKGDTVTGYERWVLFTNPKWAAKGGKDCVLEWTITGTKAATGQCAGCDLAISFHAEPRLDSNCPEELVLGRKLENGKRVSGEGAPFNETYAIKRDASGAATVYWAKSGKRLGQGYHAGDTFNYVSDHQCKWF